MRNLFGLLVLVIGFQSYAAEQTAEQNCRDEIRARVLASATTLTSGTTVSDFKSLVATGKTVKTKQGETLEEYTLTDLSTDDGWIPDSSAAIYVKKDSLTCTVIRMNVNLR